MSSVHLDHVAAWGSLLHQRDHSRASSVNSRTPAHSASSEARSMNACEKGAFLLFVQSACSIAADRQREEAGLTTSLYSLEVWPRLKSAAKC